MPKGRPLPDRAQSHERSRVKARYFYGQVASMRLTRDGSALNNAHLREISSRVRNARTFLLTLSFMTLVFITLTATLLVLDGAATMCGRNTY